MYLIKDRKGRFLKITHNNNINKAVRYFEDFEYEEYKNREIEDVRAFLFGG